jgi:hypothetical protein
LQWKALAYFIAIWSILVWFGIFCRHLVNFIAVIAAWYIFSRFGMLYQEKSGNPGCGSQIWRKWNLETKYIPRYSFH